MVNVRDNRDIANFHRSKSLRLGRGKYAGRATPVTFGALIPFFLRLRKGGGENANSAIHA
jgi:hypothetical protein